MAFYLPGKVPSYLIRLSHNYATDSRNAQLKAVLDSARVFVAEGVDYDNYNGGMDGHGVILFLPLEILGPIDLLAGAVRDSQGDIRVLCVHFPCYASSMCAPACGACRSIGRGNLLGRDTLDRNGTSSSRGRVRFSSKASFSSLSKPAF